MQVWLYQRLDNARFEHGLGATLTPVDACENRGRICQKKEGWVCMYVKKGVKCRSEYKWKSELWMNDFSNLRPFDTLEVTETFPEQLSLSASPVTMFPSARYKSLTLKLFMNAKVLYARACVHVCKYALGENAKRACTKATHLICSASLFSMLLATWESSASVSSYPISGSLAVPIYDSLSVLSDNTSEDRSIFSAAIFSFFWCSTILNKSVLCSGSISMCLPEVSVTGWNR